MENKPINLSLTPICPVNVPEHSSLTPDSGILETPKCRSVGMTPFAFCKDWVREVTEYMDKVFARIDALALEIKAMREEMVLARRRYEMRRASVVA